VVDILPSMYGHSPASQNNCFLWMIRFNFFTRIYSLYRGGFIVTILIRLILYINLLPPSVSLPAPIKAIMRSFLALFHIGIWNPSTIYCHLNLLHSPSLLLLIPPHTYTVHILQSYFLLLVFKLMLKGVSQCILTVGVLFFGSLNP
jgi:hypothetical protein